jgi:hypothetical protein
LACSFSTANLSDVKLGKDKSATGSTTNFKPQDEIFAVTAVNNAGGKNKVKFRLLFDEVEGAKSGSVAYKLDKVLEVEGSRDVWFNFSAPGEGIVPGSYKVEAVLLGEDGKELDRKTTTFSVNGTNSSKTTKTNKPKKESSDDTDEESTSDNKKSDSNTEENSEENE